MPEVATHPSEPGRARPAAPGLEARTAPGRRGRRPGVEIKPGTVKRARLEAGLSLGQVARGDISRTAIYFVETGKSKPSMETLVLIAQRTGKPVEYFLADPAPTAVDAATVVEVERLVATGELESAIAAGEAALARRPDADTAARIRFRIAMAYLRTSRFVHGRREASLARAHYEQTGDTVMVAECLGTEASAAYLMQDPGALALAEGALETCRSARPVPQSTEARLLAVIGAVHTANHEWDRAIAAYEQAVAVGAVVQDLRSLSVMYGNLSLAYQEIGRLADAARYAHRAMAIYETMNDRLSLAGAENDLALLFRKQGNLTDAFRHAYRALEMWEQSGTEARKAHVLMTLAELEFERDDMAAARGFAVRALDVATRGGEGANAGEAHLWLARIAEAAGNYAVADGEFAQAFDAFGPHGQGERLGRAHALYAEALEGRGDLIRANAHLKLALNAVARGGVAAEARTATA